MWRTVFAAALFLCPCICWAENAAVRPDVEAGNYVVEPAHTQIMFSVNHMGLSTFYGMFSNASGSLTLDPKTLSASSVSVSVPVDSVSTTSAKLTEYLKSSGWLDAQRDPVMVFKSTRITATGPRTAQMVGNLTIHGITRPVTFEVVFHGAGTNPLDQSYTVGFDAAATIRRTEFGVNKYVQLVSNETVITISAAFEKR